MDLRSMYSHSSGFTPQDQDNTAMNMPANNGMNTVPMTAQQVPPEKQKIIDDILNYVSEKFKNEIAMAGGVTPAIQNKINATIEQEVLRYGLNGADAALVQKQAIESTGLGPLEALLSDPTITEIVVQRYDDILIEQGGRLQKIPAAFNSNKHLEIVINKIVQEVGRVVNISQPICDARLKDGSRVNAVIPPIAPDGATLCIRKFSDKKLTGEDYLRFGSLDERILDFVTKCVEGRCTTFVSGGTGTGKTTFLNMLSNAIPKHELIVTIEDTCELRLQSDRVRRMETRTVENSTMMFVDTAMCVKNALRMRPDRIIVGEIRDGCIVDFLSAASTGHEGSLATAHANDPRNMCNVRLPILYSQNELMSNISEKSQFLQFYEAVHLMVHLKRMKNGKRVVSEVTEVSGIDENTGKIILNPIFKYSEKTDGYYSTGFIPTRILDVLDYNGVMVDMDLFEDQTAMAGVRSTAQYNY